MVVAKPGSRYSERDLCVGTILLDVLEVVSAVSPHSAKRVAVKTLPQVLMVDFNVRPPGSAVSKRLQRQRETTNPEPRARDHVAVGGQTPRATSTIGTPKFKERNLRIMNVPADELIGHVKE